MDGKFKEVISISSSNPFIHVHNTSFTTFGQHNRGVGMTPLSKMGYEGGGLGIDGQGITNLIMVQERPKYQGLGYGQREFGEFSKRFEANQSSEDDMSHQDGGDNVHLSPKRCECFKGPCMSSSNPHCQSCNLRDKYKSHGCFPNVGNFDYLWDTYPCTFCDAVDHCVVVCEQLMVTVKRMDHIVGIKHDESPSHLRTSLSASKIKYFCTHFKMHRHGNERCWKLHPKLHPKKDKEVMQTNVREARRCKEDSQRS